MEQFVGTCSKRRLIQVDESECPCYWLALASLSAFPSTNVWTSSDDGIHLLYLVNTCTTSGWCKAKVGCFGAAAAFDVVFRCIGAAAELIVDQLSPLLKAFFSKAVVCKMRWKKKWRVLTTPQTKSLDWGFFTTSIFQWYLTKVRRVQNLSWKKVRECHTSKEDIWILAG